MRKGILYAPRVQGDLDLGLEPTRVRGTVKDWARMDFPGGKVPGGSDQDLYVATVAKNFRLGTRRVVDERVYRYCKASVNGCAQPYWGAQNMQNYKSDETEDCIVGTTVGDKEADDTTLVVADTNTAHIADFFEGGWVHLIVGSTLQRHRIRSNTACAPGNVTIYLWDPLAIDVAAGSSIVVYPSIYSKVERILGGGDTKKPTVCVPNIIIPASRYFWGQTWGPCVGIPSGTFPDGTYEMRLVFSYDGSIMLEPAVTANNVHQTAGYRLIDYLDITGACMFYMLTLAP